MIAGLDAPGPLSPPGKLGPMLASCNACRAFSRSSVVAPLNVHECDEVAAEDLVLQCAGASLQRAPHVHSSYHFI
ncbi:hypothetical protein PGTUg99_023254 [Puccinia graminis f. sp. tritici]|uniref:Uncharacterized protein n=1 Tax=Puccinia graminis f. sp. tritici TaxID=56615 RepID=A0A5B0MF24_PUCGR|nr:hypothetical protein PGTUg99_023254 [Puccinia graminis f. sp. tritici]